MTTVAVKRFSLCISRVRARRRGRNTFQCFGRCHGTGTAHVVLATWSYYLSVWPEMVPRRSVSTSITACRHSTPTRSDTRSAKPDSCRQRTFH